MRRLAVLLVLPLLAFGAGCGDDDDDGGGGGGVAASGNFCERAKVVDAQFSALEEEFSGSEIPSADVFEEAADAIAGLADDAPSEIKEDLETVADGVREIAQVFGEIDLSDPEAVADPANAAALEEMGARMEELDAEVTEATDRIETYLKDECGIEIDG